MKLRSAAIAFALLLLATPLLAPALAAPPQDTVSLLGGASARPALNVVPQEIDAEGQVVREDPAGEQRLVTAPIYDCATGEPTGFDAYSFDVVLVHRYGHFLTVSDGDAYNRIAPALGDNREDDPEPYTYGAATTLGFGAEAPLTLYPGPYSFYAFLKCGGFDTGILPRPDTTNPAQKIGMFGWADEDSVRGAGQEANPLEPDFHFTYVPARIATSGSNGKPLPGDLSTQGGWHMRETLVATGDGTAAGATFRFVVNPATTPELYPGYANSRHSGAASPGCLLQGEDTRPEESGLFENCAQGAGYQTERHAYQDAGLPAPTLEDIERFRPAPVAAETVEQAYREALAAAAHAQGVAAPAVEAAQEAAEPALDAVPDGTPRVAIAAAWGMEPNQEEESELNNFSLVPGSAWNYYLDVRRASSMGSHLVEPEPLYGSGLTDGHVIYPTFVGFTAYFGLARDANGDGEIDTTSAAEWYQFDDAIPASIAPGGGDINFADVGHLDTPAGGAGAGGATLELKLGSESFVILDNCRRAFASEEAGPGTYNVIGNAEIATCNPEGDPAEGWGTFIQASTGYFYASRYFMSTTGTLNNLWETSVEARVRWPTSAEWQTYERQLPASFGVTDYDGQLAGRIIVLKDIDRYGPSIVRMP